MTKPETIKKLEKRYHCKIDQNWDYKRWPYKGEFEYFHIYSLDGCHWDCVIGYRSLIKTLVEDKDALRRLAGLDYLIKKEAMV